MGKKEYPWFPVYAAETLADGRFQGWNLEERGAWLTLLCFNWNDGSIPGTPTALSRLLHVEPSDAARIWSVIGDRFNPVPGKPDRFSSPRLESERDKAAQVSKRRSDAGRTGADARWQGHKPEDGKGMRLPSACHGDRNANRCPEQSQSQSPDTAAASEPTPIKPLDVHLQGSCPDLAAALRRSAVDVEIGRRATVWGEADGLVRQLGEAATLSCWETAAAKRGSDRGAVPLAYLLYPMRDLVRRGPGRGPQPVSQDFTKTLEDVAREREEALRGQR